MRETVRSLRLYLIISGALATLAYVRTIVGVGMSTDVLWVLPSLALSVAYLVLGVRLSTWLASAPRRVFRILKIGMGYLAFLLALGALSGAFAQVVAPMGLGLLITWYVLANARRLAGEIQPGQPAPSHATP
jgi:hypothetical protein